MNRYKRKINVNKKEIFDGQITGFESIYNKYISPNYPDIKYKIVSSKSTKSFYVKLSKEQQYVNIRFSDHCPRNNITSYNINKNILVSNIISIIMKNIKRLNSRCFYAKIYDFKV